MPGSLRLSLVYEDELRPVEGYSLGLTLAAYGFGWVYWGGGGGRVLLCPGAVAELSVEGGVVVRYRVYAGGGAGCWEEAVGLLGWALGAVEDYSGFHRLAAGDPLAGCMAAELRGLRLRGLGAWPALLVGVAQQNASFRQGWGMLYRLHLAAGRRLLGPGWVYVEPPAPGPGLVEAARAAGWGYRARFLGEAAARAAGLGLAAWSLERGVCLSAAGELEEARGVGAYTAALIRLLGCKDYSAAPVDRWLLRLAAEAYGVEERAVPGLLRERFPGYSGLAAYAATLCCDAQPLRRALERLRRGECRPGLDEPSPLTLWRQTPPPQSG